MKIIQLLNAYSPFRGGEGMAVVPRKVEISCVGLSDVRDKEGMNLSGDSERPFDDHDKMLSQLTTK